MRDWVERFETGEYLRKWRGIDPHWLLGIYCDEFKIGENKYSHCMGSFYGIGDVEWWVKAELDKLTDQERDELESICNYKKYVNENITHPLIVKISSLFNCETQFVYRMGNKRILEFINTLNNFRDGMMNDTSSKSDTSKEADNLRGQKNIFNIMSFEEFKQNKL